MKKNGCLVFRKTQLKHAAGYDIMYLLKLNGIVSLVEDERQVVIGPKGKGPDALKVLLENKDFG